MTHTMILLLMIISVSNGKYYLIKTSDDTSQDYMMSRNRAGVGCEPASIYSRKEVACKRGYNYLKFWGFILSISKKVKEPIVLSKPTQMQKLLLSVGKRLVNWDYFWFETFFAKCSQYNTEGDYCVFYNWYATNPPVSTSNVWMC